MDAHGRLLVLVGLTLVGLVVGAQLVAVGWALGAVVGAVSGVEAEMLHRWGGGLLVVACSAGMVLGMFVVVHRRRW